MIERALVIGSMNCMPTEYALLLKDHCREVVHYYDAADSDSLSNPRIRWGAASRKRTEGIIIRKMYVRHYLSFLLPRLLHQNLLNEMENADLILLSGPAISLASHIPLGKKTIIGLSYGGDVSIFCDREWPHKALPKARNIRGLIASQLNALKAKFVELQIAGLRSCTHYSYFIPGFDTKTDALLDEVLAGSSTKVRLPRYSIGLDLLEYEVGTKLSSHADKYKILFPVRFCEDELFGDKGWRLLFDGLKRFKQKTKTEFICICFEKGNYHAARNYAAELGLGDLIEWHRVVPFDTLVQYYHAADVVVEQLGSHWIAQGLFAMALGKPVIGRLSTPAQRVFFTGSGLLSIENVDSLVECLAQCESESFRAEIGREARAFVPANAAIGPEFLGWGVV